MEITLKRADNRVGLREAKVLLTLVFSSTTTGVLGFCDLCDVDYLILSSK